MILWNVLVAEVVKLRRSKITWLSWLAFSIMPLAGGLFMWIVKEPERAAKLGLLGQKARFAGFAADWSGYFAFLLQAELAGLVLASVIAAFVFGREYSEGTAKNMLTLPVSRHWFTAAKLIVVLGWWGLLTAAIVAEGFVVGWALGLPGFSVSLAVGSLGHILLESLVIYLLVPIVAWVAVLGRGYLAPIGFAIFMLLLGNILGATGWGKWFPWSIVPLIAEISGPRMETVTAGSILVLAFTFVAGVAATALQMRHADNTQ